MAIETLANLEVYDSSVWNWPNGTGKGVSVYDSSSWNIVKEIYVYDSGAWHYVHPCRATSCTISTTNNGFCPSIPGYYRTSMFGSGPTPQAVAGTGHYYFWKYYRRFSIISSADCTSKAWSFLGSTTAITGGFTKTSGNISTGYVLGGPTTNLWTQFQARLFHSVYGEMTQAEGGIATSTVKPGKRDDCGPE